MPMGVPLDLVGQRFGRLTVIGVERKPTRWICRCDCGTVKSVSTCAITQGNTVSCGCKHSEWLAQNKPAQTHGKSKTKEYICWLGMRSRCTNPKNRSYSHYGGRGITVCDRWAFSFENFLKDMGTAPSAKHSLDRIDNDGPYSPLNCRWALDTEQQRNRPRTIRLTYLGETLTLPEWANHLGIPPVALWKRLDNGWTIERALSTPVRRANRTPK